MALRCNNMRSPKLRFHPCGSKMLCSTNQQLATQAASHIHQLQQILRPSSSVPNSQTPAPSEIPQPTIQPEVKTTTPPPVHTDEMLQKLRTDFKEGMENIVQKFHYPHHPPTLPAPPTPINPSLPLQAPSSVPQAPNLPRSPGPDRRSRSKAPARAHYREEKRPVATYRSPPRSFFPAIRGWLAHPGLAESMGNFIAVIARCK